MQINCFTNVNTSIAIGITNRNIRISILIKIYHTHFLTIHIENTHCSHGAISKLYFTCINQMNICILVISHLHITCLMQICIILSNRYILVCMRRMRYHSYIFSLMRSSIHLFCTYFWLYSLSIVVLFCICHVVPFVLGISTIDIAMPMESATRAYFGSSGIECLLKALLIMTLCYLN